MNQDETAAAGLAEEFGRLMTPGEVARLLRVDPKTVTRWAQQGRLKSIRTPGGHRRYPEDSIRALIGGTS